MNRITRLAALATPILAVAVAAPAATLDWPGAPDWIDGTFGPYAYNAGGVAITVSVSDADGVSLPTHPTDDNGFGVPSLWIAGSFLASPGSPIVTTIEFSKPVSNVQWTMYDIDTKAGDNERVEVLATNDGAPAPITGASTGSGVEFDGVSVFEANGTSNGNPPNAPDNAAVTIDGPIDRMTISFQGFQDNIGFLIGNISFEAPVCVGDINGDGATDVLDFSILAGAFGQLVPPGTHGDHNLDGKIDVLDFAALAADFGCGT